jgi:hypothetical protein
MRFDQIEAEGFVMYVEDALGRPETWNVKFHPLARRGLFDELNY